MHDTGDRENSDVIRKIGKPAQCADDKTQKKLVVKVPPLVIVRHPFRAILYRFGKVP